MKRNRFLMFVMVLLCVLGRYSFGESVPIIPLEERRALIAVYESLNGNCWTDRSGWKDGRLQRDGFAARGTEGSWHGVICSEDGSTVEKLILDNNGLSGTLPEEFGILRNLKFLSMRQNKIYGNIPPELAILSKLESINLSGNYLEGSIPEDIAVLENLFNLNLSVNKLTLKIPPSLGKLSNLEYLNLSANQLVGNIPSSFADLKKLKKLYLSTNRFTGEIPISLSRLEHLEILELNCNRLSGNIPSELGELVQLVHLYLNDNCLWGAIPYEILRLPKLKELNLSANQLSGNIPGEITKLEEVRLLKLGYNALYSNNSQVISFLERKNPMWIDTQTVAPGNISVLLRPRNHVTLMWTPIRYFSGDGGYSIIYSKVSGNADGEKPEVIYVKNKGATNIIIDGLEPGTTYSFMIRTRTEPYALNQNTVYSDYSEIIYAGTETAGSGNR